MWVLPPPANHRYQILQMPDYGMPEAIRFIQYSSAPGFWPVAAFSLIKGIGLSHWRGRLEIRRTAHVPSR